MPSLLKITNMLLSQWNPNGKQGGLSWTQGALSLEGNEKIPFSHEPPTTHSHFLYIVTSIIITIQIHFTHY